jgi:hypothetical protein
VISNNQNTAGMTASEIPFGRIAIFIIFETAFIKKLAEEII